MPARASSRPRRESTLDLQAAAARCGYHPDYLRKLAKEGGSPFEKKGRRWVVAPTALDDWMDERERSQAAS
jgi:excisionase family DNA binding protein